MLNKTLGLTAIATCASIALAACASTAPSQQLVDARSAYQEAAATPGANLEQDELLAARQALAQAEAIHEEEAGSPEEVHYAYLAERRANLAAARAQQALALQERRQADERYEAAQAALRMQQTERLDETRQALEETQRELDEVQAALSTAGGRNESLIEKRDQLQRQQAELHDRLNSEQQARVQAEETAAAAMASLERIAQIKSDARETVITLSGSVLFETGKAALLPIAKQRLSTVAHALKQQDGDKVFVVEGHTDSRGAEDSNQRLSLERAESVRAFLIEQGVPQDRIQAVGRGEIEPIATNDSPEGRANNRRVEIVVRSDQAQRDRQPVRGSD